MTFLTPLAVIAVVFSPILVQATFLACGLLAEHWRNLRQRLHGLGSPRPYAAGPAAIAQS
jgi:hypothetical protein